MDHTVLHRSLAADLSTSMIYALLRLRVDVFVVELNRPYQELDGHDLDRTTRHFWLAPHGAIERPQATLRLLEPADRQFRIDRVCTAADARGQGGVRRLLEAALGEIGDAPCVVDAPLDCVELFEAFGFEIAGAQSTEGGLAQRPMRRDASARIR
ncbi:MAG TPA: GNAT family N-acetyltransferase [Pseudonocardiaceae bacterium]|nr:GNAT family N-acetyltransferase [Pseudonocardiaceae bacterium]